MFVTYFKSFCPWLSKFSFILGSATPSFFAIFLMVSDTIKKIAKKEGVAEPKMKENLLNQGKKLLK